MSKIIRFQDWDCTLKQSKYNNNNRIALELFDTQDGSPVAVATVNLSDEPLGENEVIIKNYSENEGMVTALIEAGIIGEVKRVISNGWVKFHVCDLLISKSK